MNDREARIAIVLSNSEEPGLEALDGIRSTLEMFPDACSTEVYALTQSEYLPADDLHADDFNLIITIGPAAAGAVLEVDTATAVLSVLMTKEAFESLRDRCDRKRGTPRKASAVYLDIPFAQQLGFARQLLPHIQRAGVVLENASGALRDEIRATAAEQKLKAEITVFDGPGKDGALDAMLNNSDVILTLATPHNGQRVRQITASAGEKGIPVIASLPIDSDAGVLGAIFATPRQLGRYAGELVLQLALDGNWMPGKSSFSPYYNIAVDHATARALQIDVVDERLPGRVGAAEYIGIMAADSPDETGRVPEAALAAATD